MKTNTNQHQIVISILIIYTLFFSLIIPIQISAKPVPANSVFEQNNDTPKLDKSIGNNSVYFEKNQGQFNERVKYFTRGTNGYSLFLTSTEAVYVLRSPESRVQNPKSKTTELKFNSSSKTQESAKSAAIYMTLVGANEDSDTLGIQETAHKTNYFKGKESDWQTDIPNFKKVRMENVYEGIDTIWHGKDNGDVQYDFVVQPNMNPNHIEWEIEGADSVEIDEKGSLIIKTEFGIIEQAKPFTYQDNDNFRQEIESNFEMKGDNRVGFTVGEYDTSKTLTIDPTVGGQVASLQYSTYLGGNGDDVGYRLGFTNNDQVILAGSTNSTSSFPTTPGTFDNTQAGGDIFISKFNAFQTDLEYSTYLGGDNAEFVYDMKVNQSDGSVYITGFTEPTTNETFPITPNAFDTTHNGNRDAFITALNPTGNSLTYSSFLGSEGDDIGSQIEVDTAQNIYISGQTQAIGISANPFPTTAGANDVSHNGANDIFVTKLNISNSSLVYSTFIGGQSDESVNGMDIDQSGNVYITGYTDEVGLFGNYPTTQGSFDRLIEEREAFVTKLNPSGNSLVYSTFLGGSESDEGTSIKVDSSGNAYVGGSTATPANNAPSTFPTTQGAYDVSHNGETDGFVTKINPSGTQLLFSTFLGGGRVDNVYSLTIDDSGSILVFGDAQSLDFPLTNDAIDTTGDLISNDCFISRFNSFGSRLEFSTFLGGNNEERCSDIKLDNQGKIYVTGSTELVTNGQVFPITGNAYDNTHNGNHDAFIANLFIPEAISDTPYDFDGDGRTDISIFRPDVGQWWYLRSSDSDNRAFAFGNSNDVIVPGDYTGDGKTDVAFFRPSSSEWFILRSEDSSFFGFPFGASGDIPAPGDYDGDGKTDAAVFRPSNATWYISNSSGGTTITPFGVNGDVPTIADYDGDGKDDIAIYRPSNSQWWLNRSSLGVIAYEFGQAGDQTVQGDYTGDGKADVAFWRPSNGNWFILRSEDTSFFGFPFGTSGDIPTPGDYDGDGKFDAAVFRPINTTWYLNQSTAGTSIQGFGISGDQPIPNSYVYQ